MLWVFLGIFAAFLALPKVHDNRVLLWTFVTITGLLAAAILWLSRDVAAKGRILTYNFEPRAVHYVQFSMHSLIFAYWGWYWPEVYRHIPLILAQVAFSYVLNMLVGWWRRDNWTLGFGPIPIIFSTNLFMWFRDDWFYLQFLMVALGVFGKEFLTWQRDGRRVHIFNPSAFGLFCFSVMLLITHKTSITWGEQIALSFHSPPNMYLEIFCVGLVVQALFSVTLVTLCAAASLFALNLAYTRATGVYYFIDSTIPPAVFLGLHLLVTDPATSPKSTSGKIAFGAAYGGSVFGLYTLLGMLGMPTFYDKLLCVPPLNLTVKVLDFAGRKIDDWFRRLLQHAGALARVAAWNPKQANYAFMSIWILLFVTVSATGFLTHDHPGKSIDFWRNACEAGKHNACGTWSEILRGRCADGDREMCLTLGRLLEQGQRVARDPAESAKAYGKACDLGLVAACSSLGDSIKAGAASDLESTCAKKDGVGCFLLGFVYHRGLGVTADESKSFSYFHASCDAGFARGCGRLGESYLYGEGIAKDEGRALQAFEQACDANFGPACMNAAQLYSRGPDAIRSEVSARSRFQRACALGVRPACSVAEGVPVTKRVDLRGERGE